MRPFVVAANWKMHTIPAEAGPLAAAIADRTRVDGIVRIICPPFVSLAAVRDALRGTDVAVGAQNIHHEAFGAYTGEVSAPMLVGLASWVIVGHSERRRDAGETDALVSRKLARALEHGLRPILCVGEALADREAGRAEAVVAGQLAGALAGHDPGALTAAGIVVAYEPVWAIGSGQTARGEDAAAMATAIRETVRAQGWGALADALPVLYGGSVTAATVGAFFSRPEIDGALVGGASLKPDEMAGIAAQAGEAVRRRRSGS